jgi:hypothetical protein
MLPRFWLVVAGREAPRWAWSFWELIGRKKACEVSEGTWLRLAEVGGLPAGPEMLPLMLPPCRPWRRGVDCDQPPPRDDDMPVLAVPGLDSDGIPLVRGLL